MKTISTTSNSIRHSQQHHTILRQYSFATGIAITILLASCFSTVGSAFVVRSSTSAALARRSSSSSRLFSKFTSTSVAPMSSSLAHFLAEQKSTFEISSQKHLIIGNPAGDADSIISALSLAHVDHQLSLTKKVPIVSIPRADMALRRETVLLLTLLGIDIEESLLYLDDLPTAADEGSTITLVDHNQLVYPSLANYEIVEILDHHFDEEAHPQVTEEQRNVAFSDDQALVASTCTLVAERLLAAGAADKTIPADLSFALLAVILLDTVNMSPAAGKGTARDEHAMTALVQQTDWSSMLLPNSGAIRDFFTTDGEPDKTKLYDYLSQSKFDVEFWKSLSVTDALRLDYKQFTTAPSGDAFGAASVLLPLSDFLAKPNWEAQMLQYMTDCQIPLLAVLSMVIVDDAPQRSMLICGSTNNGELVEAMVNHLERTGSLQLQPISASTSSEKLTVHQFVQGNARASRKQVVPIMLDYYNCKA
jgi:exopolyphosphatase